jgi:hypothetical protein
MVNARFGAYLPRTVEVEHGHADQDVVPVGGAGVENCNIVNNVPNASP